MRILSSFLIATILALTTACGGSSSGPQVVSGILIEAPGTALRGSVLTIIPRAQLSSASSVAAASLPPRNGSTTLIPPRITVTVEHGSLLSTNGDPVSSLTVDTGTEVRWQLPDSVGTYVVRGSYENFSTSATVLTTDPA